MDWVTSLMLVTVALWVVTVAAAGTLIYCIVCIVKQRKSEKAEKWPCPKEYEPHGK